MTRPETLVSQLSRAVIGPLIAEFNAIRQRSFPPPPVTPQVRELWRRYQRASKLAASYKAALEKAGGATYSTNGKPRMREDGSARTAAAKTLQAQIAKATELRDVALLGVLGLDAATARPIVLKLKADLERVMEKGRK